MFLLTAKMDGNAAAWNFSIYNINNSPSHLNASNLLESNHRTALRDENYDGGPPWRGPYSTASSTTADT